MMSDDATQYRRVKDLLIEALEQPDHQRLDWVMRNTPDDGEIRAEVLELIEAHFQAEAADSLEALFDHTSVRQPPDYRLGQEYGAWRLTEFLGNGGMGSVFKAVRADGAFEKEAAVKIVRSDINVDRLVQRFEQERNTLAKLDHPNVARLLDGGNSAAGPFIVMEYVDGVEITRLCSEQNVTLDAKVRLFLQVCEAVGYAHQNLVVHRDLKPSNILVTSDGVVKLLDFGIARLIDEDDQKVMTQAGGIMTPAYAAPEQLQDGLVTTATDTYCLGLVLFELLSGKRPFDLSGKTASQIEAAVCNELSPAPSQLREASYGNEMIPADLDWIVLKALAKEPERRYSSAEALGDDLRRFQAGDPVSARNPTVSYRVSRFVRKNAFGVAAAAIVFVSLLVGLSTALWQARVAERERDRAEERFDLAREVTSTLLFDIHDAISNLSGSTPAREMIIARSLSYLEQLDKTTTGHVQLRVDIAKAYRRIGDVLGNPSNNNLGRVSEAIQSYEKGLTALDGIEDASNPDPDVERTKAVLHEKLADVTAHTGDIEGAIRHLHQAVDVYRSELDRSRSVDNYLALAVGNIKMGDYTGNRHFPNLDDPLAAHEMYENSLVLIGQAIRLETENQRAQRYLGLIYERLGTVQEQLGLVAESRESYRQSLNFREKLWQNDPGDMNLYRDAGIAHEKVGLNYQEEGQLTLALQELEVAHSYYLDIVSRDPSNANARITLAVGEMQLGALMYNRALPHFDDAASSATHYRRAMTILKEVHHIDTSNVRTQSLIDETQIALENLSRLRRAR